MEQLWTLERIRTTGYRPTLRETLAEFIGATASVVLALCFVTLGTMLLHRSQATLPAAAPLPLASWTCTPVPWGLGAHPSWVQRRSVHVRHGITSWTATPEVLTGPGQRRPRPPKRRLQRAALLLVSGGGWALFWPFKAN